MRACLLASTKKNKKKEVKDVDGSSRLVSSHHTSIKAKGKHRHHHLLRSFVLSFFLSSSPFVAVAVAVFGLFIYDIVPSHLQMSSPQHQYATTTTPSSSSMEVMAPQYQSQHQQQQQQQHQQSRQQPPRHEKKARTLSIGGLSVDPSIVIEEGLEGEKLYYQDDEYCAQPGWWTLLGISLLVLAVSAGVGVGIWQAIEKRTPTTKQDPRRGCRRYNPPWHRPSRLHPPPKMKNLYVTFVASIIPIRNLKTRLHPSRFPFRHRTVSTTTTRACGRMVPLGTNGCDIKR